MRNPLLKCLIVLALYKKPNWDTNKTKLILGWGLKSLFFALLALNSCNLEIMVDIFCYWR